MSRYLGPITVPLLRWKRYDPRIITCSSIIDLCAIYNEQASTYSHRFRTKKKSMKRSKTSKTFDIVSLPIDLVEFALGFLTFAELCIISATSSLIECCTRNARSRLTTVVWNNNYDFATSLIRRGQHVTTITTCNGFIGVSVCEPYIEYRARTCFFFCSV